MGYKESNEGDGAIDAIKPMRWFNMLFKGSVEPFNPLFECSERFRFAVEILESNDLLVLDRRVMFS